jgi:CubicO group peptidase (beta-lactamase class C family)
MKAFDVPGVAIGILLGDKLVYRNGYGVRSKGRQPVDTETVFQIGSATKPFLATTLAIAVDRAIKAAPNHAEGYRYAPDGSVEVPFTQFFPYNFARAGDINSDIEDMAHWVSLHLGNCGLVSILDFVLNGYKNVHILR